MSLEKQFLQVHDVMEILHISKSGAYKVISDLNKELEAKGYLIKHGKVSSKYFYEKTYC